jgi:hypothetical protein
MYFQNKWEKTDISLNQSTEGESIEQKIERVTQNKEPIKDGAPLVYTDRKDGVLAGYNIRTDRFDVAIDAMDVVQKSINAKREHKANLKVVKDDGGAEPTQGTNNGTE